MLGVMVNVTIKGRGCSINDHIDIIFYKYHLGFKVYYVNINHERLKKGAKQV